VHRFLNFASRPQEQKLKGTKVVCGAKVPRVRKFHGTKVLGLFAPRERMFHGTKVPRERKFSLWSFRSRERKCRGTKRPVTVRGLCGKGQRKGTVVLKGSFCGGDDHACARYSAIRRLEAMTRVYGKTENSTPRKYEMDKDIQTPPRIYDYIAELSCCAQSEQNRLTQFCWGNKASFFYSQYKQIISSRLQITNMEGSETFMAQNAWFHAQMCLFGASLITNHV